MVRKTLDALTNDVRVTALSASRLAFGACEAMESGSVAGDITLAQSDLRQAAHVLRSAADALDSARAKLGNVAR